MTAESPKPCSQQKPFELQPCRVGSCVTVNTGNAVALAAKDVPRHVQLVAEKLLGWEPEQVEI